MASIIEARITNDFVNTEILWGTVHSKFRSVLNVKFIMPDTSIRLITILPPRFTGIPDSFVISEEYFSQISKLQIGTKVKKTGFTFLFFPVTELLEGTPACLRTSRFYQKVISDEKKYFNNLGFVKFLEALKQYRIQINCADGFSHFTKSRRTEVEALLQQFCAALLIGDKERIASIVPQCVGMGIGLTPSVDDAIVGILAVFYGALVYGNRMNSMGDAMLPDKLIKNNTTDVSMKYLHCAREGRFSEVLFDLVYSIFFFNDADMDLLIEAVAKVGGTSGMDMLIGVSIGCQNLIVTLPQ